MSGVAFKAKPEFVFDEPREQKTGFPKKSIENVSALTQHSPLTKISKGGYASRTERRAWAIEPSVMAVFSDQRNG